MVKTGNKRAGFRFDEMGALGSKGARPSIAPAHRPGYIRVCRRARWNRRIRAQRADGLHRRRGSVNPTGPCE